MKSCKFSFFLFLLLLISSPMMATNFTVAGQVSIDQQTIPSGGVTVTVFSEFDQQVETINTDDNGAYSLTLDVDSPGFVFFLVEVFDDCSQTSNVQSVFVEPDGTGTADFLLCTNNGGGPVDCGCPTEIDEVCVEILPGLTIPFPNACEAECAGYTAADFVECIDFPVDTTNGGGPVDCGCPTEIDEVCVEIFPGVTIPFPNACEAECAGFTAADFVECIDFPVDTTNGGGPVDCGCPTEIDEVCVEIFPGVTIPFPNACEAECAGFTAADFVECIDFPVDTTHCGCDCDWDPVCVEIDSTQTLTFVNACLAECEGYDPADFVECEDDNGGGPVDCGCPTEIDEVCVELFPGLIIPFPNACEAECAGFDASMFVDCDNGGGPVDCGCTADYDPVCVEIFPGVIIEYPNQCLAECDGYTDFVDCDNGPVDCGCSYDYDPVCVEIDPGFIIEYTNQCLAECDGYTDFVECNFNPPVEDLCQAFFFPAPSIDNPLEVQFIDLSFFTTSAINSWSWDFGDGNTSTEQNPLHTYATEDTYEVTLTIETDDCTSEFMMAILAGDSGNAGFCIALYNVDFKDELEVEFTDFSTADFTSWSWDFGDGNTSTERNPTHKYDVEGDYYVSVVAETADGCVSEFGMFLNLEDGNFQGNAVPTNRTTGINELTTVTASSLSPNPTQGELAVSLKVTEATELAINVLTIDGKLLQSSNHQLGTGQQQIDLSLSNLPQGMYLLQLRTEKEQQVLKFVKQ